MAEADIQRYLDGIEAQHSSKPKFMAHLTALLNKVDSATRLIKDMPGLFYVQTAGGEQLDAIGQLVGVDRRSPVLGTEDVPYLDDDRFRRVILARIVQNQWNGTNGDFKAIWDATMTGLLDAEYTDNMDMTMTIRLTGYTDRIIIEMILRGFILPKPAGVGIDYEISNSSVMGVQKAACLSANAARFTIPTNDTPNEEE